MDTYKIAIVADQVKDTSVVAYYDRIMTAASVPNLKGLRNMNGTLEIHCYDDVALDIEILMNLPHSALKVVIMQVKSLAIFAR